MMWNSVLGAVTLFQKTTKPFDAVIPSRMDAGLPVSMQLTVRLPRLPSEYLMPNTTRPALACAGLPMVSVAGGDVSVPGAGVKVRRVVTLYVPLPVEVPVGANVVHVPPPVTSSGSPGSKIPEPVMVIMEPSLAFADPCPPADMTPAVLTLTMSQRTLVS